MQVPNCFCATSDECILVEFTDRSSDDAPVKCCKKLCTAGIVHFPYTVLVARFTMHFIFIGMISSSFEVFG